MLPFGFADTFFSTLDLPTLYHTVRLTGSSSVPLHPSRLVAPLTLTHTLTGRSIISNLLHGKI